MTMTRKNARRRCILVLGMHRSGTSAVARTLSLLGATLPKNLMQPAAGNNEAGFWEPQKLVELNDLLLTEGGSRWDDWRPFDFDALPGKRQQYYRQEISSLIKSEYESGALLVLKDPRISRLVPLYLSVFKDLGIETTFVHVNRNPLSVMNSLSRRDEFSDDFSGLLWLGYNLEAERATRELSRVFVSYEDLLKSWRAPVGNIRKTLDIKWPRTLKASESDIGKYLSRDRQHHSFSLEELENDKSASEWVKTAYRAFKTLEDNSSLKRATDTLDRVLAQFSEWLPAGHVFFQELIQREKLSADWKNKAHAWNGGMVAAKAHAKQLEAKTQELETQAQQLRGRTAELSGELTAVRNSSEEMATKASLLHEKLTAYRDHAHELEIKTSSLQNQLSSVRGRSSQLESTAAGLNEKLVSYRDHASNLEKKVAELEEQTSRLKHERDKQEKSIARLSNNESLITAQLLEARSHINVVHQSMSWALTRPLRGAKRAIREKGFLRNLIINVGKKGRLYSGYHFLRGNFHQLRVSGKRISLEHGEAERSEVAIIRKSGLFDEVFYLEEIGAADYSDRDPIEHYCTEGHLKGYDPNRYFSTAGYMAAYQDLKGIKVSPFTHYLLYGKAEGRLPNPFAYRKPRADTRLARFGSSEYGPIEDILNFRQDTPLEGKPPSFCVHLHLFHTGMAEQFVTVLNRLTVPFTLLVSMPDDRPLDVTAEFWRRRLKNLKEVIVRTVVNRGRDVAPWLIDFRTEVESHDIFLHMHSKRSPYSSEHAFWFRYLSHTVVGSSGIVNQVLNIFSEQEDIGLIAPPYAPFLNRQPNFGQVRETYQAIAERLGETRDLSECPDYPAGSFFWCRTSILKPLYDLDLTVEDFDPEEGQTCGTFAHALERIMGLLPGLTGKRMKMVAVDVPFELAPDVPVDEGSQAFLSDYGTENPLVDLNEAQLRAAFGCLEHSDLKISVVMATWNRKASLPHAIDSVLNQSFPVFEIIVIDDGSTDGTPAILKERYQNEIEKGFLKILELSHQGVSAARNAGMSMATGDIITYLDSDNAWRENYCLLVAATLQEFPHVNSVYTGLAYHDKSSLQPDYRLRDYDRASLVSENYIDLNIFAHRRAVVSERTSFDEKLTRLVDWDLILKITRHDPPRMIPYIGADYHIDRHRLANISLTVPLGDNLDRLRNNHDKERTYFGAAFRVAIKCPAPSYDEIMQWGDYHFSCSLKLALEKQGFNARIDILPDWYGEHTQSDDAVIVLRGLSQYDPSPGTINVMWNLSHPDKVGLDEYRSYDHSFVASFKDAQRARQNVGATVTPLLQCSDTNRFMPALHMEEAVAGKVLFVGNSRGVDRWMPTACLEAGIPFVVYGAGWEGRLPDAVLAGDNIANEDLHRYYSSAAIVLNDHWPEMARRGFISNRIFDAGLSGAYVISDDFEGSELFGDSIDICKNVSELKALVDRALSDPAFRKEKSDRLRRIVSRKHTFDHRAFQISEMIKDNVLGRLGISNEIVSLQTDRRV